MGLGGTSWDWLGWAEWGVRWVGIGQAGWCGRTGCDRIGCGGSGWRLRFQSLAQESPVATYLTIAGMAPLFRMATSLPFPIAARAAMTTASGCSVNVYEGSSHGGSSGHRDWSSAQRCSTHPRSHLTARGSDEGLGEEDAREKWERRRAAMGRGASLWFDWAGAQGFLVSLMAG